MVRLSNEERKTPVKLDSKDIKILMILTENARMPIAEIAKKMHMSRD
ncbi:MAG: AsnC family transcriptional regulator, partial [Candidatus Woesearchaeota archaeon]|nr:AsnC family transcriptional regulator [Candidatus Woesearchaeota archaeon]